jgi:hypothetical protein
MTSVEYCYVYFVQTSQKYYKNYNSIIEEQRKTTKKIYDTNVQRTHAYNLT